MSLRILNQNFLRNFSTNAIKEISTELNQNLKSTSEYLKNIINTTQRDIIPSTDLLDQLWVSDRSKAIKLQKLVATQADKELRIKLYSQKLQDLKQMFELSSEEQDLDLFNELNNDSEILKNDIKSYFISSLLADPLDSLSCFIELRAGAGGVESCDWVEKLSRMYLRYSLQKGFKAELIDSAKEEIAGFTKATLKIQGQNAFGWLKYEAGVHRFVRISPFDSNAKRHTSFVSVQVLPISAEGDDNDIELNSKDLKIETMRSQGAGGQHVNTTDSAVRITHIPTKTVAFCQNERSQHKNKATAMEMLKSRLYTKKLQQLSKERKDSHSQLSENAWGSQIRSYVLHPYQMIKDARSGYSTSNVNAVLDGDLHEFMYQTLLTLKKK